MTTALFYLMLSSLPDRYSFDIAKPKPNNAQSLGFGGECCRCICTVFASLAAWQNFLAMAGGTALISLALAGPPAI